MPSSFKQQSRPRPVVIQAGGIGDMFMVTPLMACLHERYGKAPYLACSHAGVPEALFEGEHPHLGGVARMGGWTRHYWLTPRQWKFVDYLRHGDAGPIYVCDARREKVEELLRRAGVSHTAAALGCPVVIFYARAQPWEYKPPECVRAGAAPGARASPVVELKAHPQSQQASDISVEQAFAGWNRLTAAISERQAGQGERRSSTTSPTLVLREHLPA